MSSQSVSLREIDDDNRHQIELLTVTPEQSPPTSPASSHSLEEAAETPDACPRYWALYDGEAAGRLRDDQRQHPAGAHRVRRPVLPAGGSSSTPASSGADSVLRRSTWSSTIVKRRPNADTLYTSHVPVPGPDVPLAFYLKYGFVLTGDVHDDEPVLALSLNQPPTSDHGVGDGRNRTQSGPARPPAAPTPSPSTAVKSRVAPVPGSTDPSGFDVALAVIASTWPGADARTVLVTPSRGQVAGGDRVGGRTDERSRRSKRRNRARSRS